MFAVAVVVGIAIGLSLGALGGGGSILTVPALVYLLGQNAHGATTASLVVVGATALAGTVAHLKGGRVRVTEGLVFGTLGVAGSVVGSRLSYGIAPADLLAAFSIFMLLAAGALAVRSRRPLALVAEPAGGVSSPSISTLDLAPHPSSEDGVGSRRSAPTMVAAASVIGLLTGFFGVGGGFVVVPALVLVMGFEMPVAVGTSLLVITINSAAALAVRIGSPVHINWALVVAFTSAAIGASVLGSRLPSAVRPERLARVFSALLVAVALYTLVRNLPHL
jgi:uncharacterized protein